jgi:glycosyltransferase involved in cell wall biosynthesis
MRVAFVSQRTPEHDEAGGGAPRRVDRLAGQLAARDHEVTVYCAQWWDGDESEREVDGVRYYAVTTSPSARWLFAAVLPVLLALQGPDLVHAAYSPPLQVLAAKLGALLARVPLVVDWYGDEPAEGRAADYAVRGPDVLLTPSRLVRTWVRERGVDAENVRVVPDSIDMTAVETVTVRGDADIVYARELDENAGLETLLLGLAELREMDWTCQVVGDGPARERYEQQAEDLRIDDRVEFVGELPLEERLSRYRAAQVFVQTAHRECFATELLWALACGCVGVVEYQADSSAHELIEHQDRGLRTTNDRELTDAIVQAADMEEMDVNGEFADYDHQAVLGRVVDLYRRLREEYGVF